MANVKHLYLGVDTLSPTGLYILIKRLPREIESISGTGIIVTSGRVMNDKGQFDEEAQGTAKEENTYYADVLEIGPEVKGISIGHRVMITKHAGMELIQGTNLFLIKQGDVLALVS